MYNFEKVGYETKDGTTANVPPMLIETTSSQTIRQTQCYTTLELLAQMVKEETAAIPFSSDKFRVQEYHSNIDAIRFVMKLIKERQANVV